MSLKKKVLNLLASGLVVFGSVPTFLTGNAFADTTEIDESMIPSYAKELKDNGDGTYDITLSVTGKSSSDTQTTKANVVVVFDTSGSMNYCTGTGDAPRNGSSCSQNEGESRLAAAKAATNNLVETLLKNNQTSGVSDMVQVSLIDFSDTASQPSGIFTTFSPAQTWINARTANGGTNWEDALTKANNVAFGDNDSTYIVFVSDGNPTYRVQSHSQGGVSDPDEYYTDMFGRRRKYDDVPAGAHGSGRGDPQGWNLADAKTAAGVITASGKSLYAIGVFGDADNMGELGGTYIDARDSTALNNAFSQIASQITNSLELTNIEITDGVTGETSVGVNGDVAQFKYYKGRLAEGQETTDLPIWTDAPAAELVNGKVVWNLGNAKVENGETVAVSFVVWPSQDVLDKVADLNNGKISYDELDAETKAQIVANRDGTYSLKTNEDFPTLDYSVVKTKIVNGQTSSQTIKMPTLNFVNPTPVPLNEKKLTVEKLWEDSLDESQRNDPENPIVEVSLDFYKESEKYNTAPIVLKSENSWKQEDFISIAPGIMVSSGHEAFELGKAHVAGYAVLEAGHDYHFEEINGDYHFELTKNTYHPMLVDNVLKNVVFEYDSEGNIVGIESMEDLETLSATNTLKGGINVTKKVIDENGEDYETNKKFELTISLKDKNGENYGEFEYKAYDKDGNKLAEFADGNKTATGSLTIELGKDETVRLVNINSGTTYSVEETGELGEAFELKDVCYAVSNGASDNYGDEDCAAKEDVVEGNSAHLATVTNVVKTGDLKISKAVSVESGNEELAKSKNFSFTLDLFEKEGDEKPMSSESFSLKDGETKEVLALPVGTYYEVKEVNVPKGFSAKESSFSGKIAKGETEEADFVNVYNAHGKATISATKLFGGLDEAFWPGEHEFTFVLSGPDGEVERKNVSSLSRTVSFEIEFSQDVESAEYTISEDVSEFADVKYIKRAENDADVVAIVSAEDNGEGEIEVSVEYTNEKTEIVNTYNPEPAVVGDDETESAVSIKKTLEGLTSGETPATFEFNLYQIQVEDEPVVEGQTVTIEGSGEAKFEEFALSEVGTYYFIIDETVGSEEFYTYDETFYLLVVEVTDDTMGQLNASVEIFKNGIEEVSEISFLNKYENPGKGGVETVEVKTPNTGRFSETASTDAKSDGAAAGILNGLAVLMTVLLAGCGIIYANEQKVRR